MIERLVIGQCFPRIEQEHLKRYEFATGYVAGKDVLDIACGSGYGSAMLADAGAKSVTGVDLSPEAVESATANFGRGNVRFAVGDIQRLTDIPDASFDLIASFETIEHVPDDQLALRELRRVLRPGAGGVLVVPAGPATYDYYDRFLGHERRYARGEMAAKALGAGLEVIEDLHLGSVLYPPFWLVKQRNRRRYGHLQGEALEARVAADIAGTRDSRIGSLACSLEAAMLARGVRLPFGIRGLTVVRRPRDQR